MSSSVDSDSSEEFEDQDDDSSIDEHAFPEAFVNEVQWVKLIENCSYKSKSDESVSRSIGIEKLCRTAETNFDELNETESGWILYNNNQVEFFSVSFEGNVFINEIHIYENLNPGSIITLEMLDLGENKWLNMWQRKTSPGKQSMTYHIFKPLLRRYRMKTNTIRITLDPRYTDRIGIHAIKLVGSERFDAYFHHRSLSQSMAKLYDQALNNINTDVQFSFEDKIINAHRNILCCRSTYFRSLLINDFLEKNQTKPVQLTDIDYESFLEILHFIYTGTYHASISFDIGMNVMIYANKINFLTAKNAAIEEICCHLRLNRDHILTVYCFAKKMSPTFDLLLDYVYDLCAEYMHEICKQNDFINLDKESMVDLICQGAQRRDKREQERLRQTAQLSENVRIQEEVD